MMDLMNVFTTRKSVRSFTGECVSEDTLQKILYAANASPVGMGKYDSVHLTVVKNAEILAEIEKNTALVFKADNHSFLYNAPELIIVSTATADNVGYSNAAIIAQDMSLAAVNENVGVCHIWSCVMALAANTELIQKLGIPAGFTPACAVAIGKTSDTYTNRNIPQDRITLNYI